MNRLYRWMAGMFAFQILLLPLGGSADAGIAVTAVVDRTEITLEDTVELSVTIEGTRIAPAPELPSLSNFRIQSQSTASTMQVINGKSVESTTYRYTLLPLRTGTFSLGPVQVSIEGRTYRTEPITLTVKEPESRPTPNAAVFVETTVSNETPYVNEQVILTFKLYYRVEVRNLELDIDYEDFRKEDLGEPRKYKRVLNGLQYQVFEMSVALFPQKPGRAEIPSGILSVDLIKRDTRQRGPLDPFFHDPFFTDPFGRSHFRTERKILRTNPFTLQVRELPEAGKPQDFSNLVGQFDIHTQFTRKTVEQGDSTTLTVTIEGQGNVFDVTFKLPDLGTHFKVYEDQPETIRKVRNQRLAGRKTFKFALVPLRAGTLEFPPLSLNFFDPEKGRYQTISTPPQTLTVIPGKEPDELNVAEGPVPSDLDSRPPVEVLGKDILPIHTNPEYFESEGWKRSQIPYYVAGLVASPIVFFTYAWIVQYRRRLRDVPAFGRRRNAYHQACLKMKGLETNGVGKNYPHELSLILREYLGNKLNLKGTACTAREMADELRRRQCDETRVERVRRLLERLEALQYSATTVENEEGLIRETRQMIDEWEKAN